MSQQASRRMAPQKRRALLLDAAADLFTTLPYAEVSIAEVARSAGVSKALVFRYFDDKRSLYLEAMRQVVERLQEASDPDPALPAEERFRIGLNGYLDVIERYPHALSSFEVGDIGRDPEVRALVEDAYAQVAARVIERLGIADPSPRLRHAVRSWFTFVRATTVEWLERREVTREELVRLQTAAFRAGVAEALGLPVTIGADGSPLLP